jgi:hypothetical protein
MFNTERNLYRRVIRAFRRIPADIRQELATREFDMDYGTSCLVGTAVKAGLARMQNLATEDVEMYDYEPGKAKQLFGGSQRVWAEIFVGVTDDRFPVIERAFTNALLETIPA